MAERCSEKNATAVVCRWLRRLHTPVSSAALALAVTVVAGVIVAVLMTRFSSDPVVTRECNGSDIQINFPTDGVRVKDFVSVAGTFDCLEESLWITVTPPLGTPHGIHPTAVDLQRQEFSGTAVLSSGRGVYRICAAVADDNARQTFEAVLEQDPPIGLPELPPGALLRACVEVLIE